MDIFIVKHVILVKYLYFYNHDNNKACVFGNTLKCNCELFAPRKQKFYIGFWILLWHIHF